MSSGSRLRLTSRFSIRIHGTPLKPPQIPIFTTIPSSTLRTSSFAQHIASPPPSIGNGSVSFPSSHSLTRPPSPFSYTVGQLESGRPSGLCSLLPGRMNGIFDCKTWTVVGRVALILLCPGRSHAYVLIVIFDKWIESRAAPLVCPSQLVHAVPVAANVARHTELVRYV